MYTATKLGDTVNKQTRRRIVTVHFSDGASEFDKDFSFAVETTVDVIKKTVKSYLDEINIVPEDITGNVADYTEPIKETPTVAELARTTWEQDKAKLAQLQELIDMGVFDGTETQIVNLRAKVKAGFKPEYLN